MEVYQMRYFGKPDDPSLSMRDVTEPILSKKWQPMMFTEGVESSLIDDHLIVNDAIFSIWKSGYHRFALLVIPTKYFFVHGSDPQRSSLQSRAIRIFTYFLQ